MYVALHLPTPQVETYSRTLMMYVALHLPTQEVDYDAMEADYDDDANGMMENDLNDKIDCHVKIST